ncbi:MAG: hypothetical protein ACOCP7_00340 [Desulfohalobiaceae bacterium]
MQEQINLQEWNLLQALQERAAKIRQLEAQAEDYLEKKDVASYKELLQQKAEILENISQELEPWVSLELAQEPTLLQEVLAHLQGFSQRAAQALELGSVFFMRMLLYPEDYIQGQPNDLEKFLSDLEKRLGQ